MYWVSEIQFCLMEDFASLCLSLALPLLPFAIAIIFSTDTGMDWRDASHLFFITFS